MEYEPELLKGNVQTLVLSVLESQPLHGYGIAKEIERRSEDALAFREGSIYPALKSLERQGFITGSWDQPPVGPAKKIYRITALGKEEARRRRQTWKSFVRSINLVLGGKPSHAKLA